MIPKPQKQMILTMRQQGSSYAEIADILSLSPNTVKSICRRSNTKIQCFRSLVSCGAAYVGNSIGGVLRMLEASTQKLLGFVQLLLTGGNRPALLGRFRKTSLSGRPVRYCTPMNLTAICF